MTGGLVLAAVGYSVLARWRRSSASWAVVGGSVVGSLGLGAGEHPRDRPGRGQRARERAGPPSAMSETSSELGGALGIAMLGSVGTAVYRDGMAGEVPAGVSLEAAEAARGTLGGAVGIARQLPDHLGAAVLATARESFTQGLVLAAAISAGLMIATAIVGAVVMRRGRGRRSS